MINWKYLKKRLLIGPDEDPLEAYRHRIEVKWPPGMGRGKLRGSSRAIKERMRPSGRRSRR